MLRQKLEIKGDVENSVSIHLQALLILIQYLRSGKAAG